LEFDAVGSGIVGDDVLARTDLHGVPGCTFGKVAIADGGCLEGYGSREGAYHERADHHGKKSKICSHRLGVSKLKI
jgi:hypothetical protein